MKRKALMITNPGDEGSDNYCPGVLVDNNEYKKYIKSKHAGAWIDQEENSNQYEIIELIKPSLDQLNSQLSYLKHESLDYLL